MVTGSVKAAKSPSVSTKDAVYEELRDAIVENRLEPGTPLSEEKLAAEHGLSRTPIREVLRHLAGDGLVDIVRNRGAFVSHLDARDLRDLFEMRQALEGFAARLAAQRMPDDELAKLDDRSRSLKRRQGKVDPKRLSAGGEDLHAAIQRASRNARLSQALDALHLHARRAFRFSMGIPQRMERSFEEHLLIVEALKRRDPDGAEAAMRAHLRSAWESVAAALADPYADGPPAGS